MCVLISGGGSFELRGDACQPCKHQGTMIEATFSAPAWHLVIFHPFTLLILRVLRHRRSPPCFLDESEFAPEYSLAWLWRAFHYRWPRFHTVLMSRMWSHRFISAIFIMNCGVGFPYRHLSSANWEWPPSGRSVRICLTNPGRCHDSGRT